MNNSNVNKRKWREVTLSVHQSSEHSLSYEAALMRCQELARKLDMYFYLFTDLLPFMVAKTEAKESKTPF